MAIRTMRDNTW